MQINDPRGSVWRKWDLHVHTPESFHNNFRFNDNEEKEKYEGIIWNKYVDELEKIENISVIGITDYFSVEGYKKILKYRQQNRLQNFDLILPNIEFRLDKFISSRRDETPKRLNYHVIFSNEIEVDKIEREFLEELHIKTPFGESRKLTRENIEEIGKILKEQHESFRDKSDYYVGCMNITVSLDEIVKILEEKKSIFSGKYLLVLAEERWSLIDWDGQDHLTRKSILVKSHAIFSANLRTRIWALGKEHETPQQFIEEFGSLKPCLHGSDAHSFEELRNPSSRRFCWIKADPTFEGLKQIIYEPEERVKVQESNPSEDYPKISCIDSIELESSKISEDLEFEDKFLPLNHDLIAIIGGRGSGKTALLDIIASFFGDSFEMIKENENSFYKRAFGDSQKEGGSTLKVRLKIKGEVAEFEKTLGLEDGKFKDGFRIEYIPQNYLDKVVADYGELTVRIKKLLFEKLPSKKEEEDKLKRELEDIKRKIRNINNEIVSLKGMIKAKGSLLKEKASVEGEFKRVLYEIRKHESQDNPVNIENITLEMTRLTRYINKLEKVKNTLEREIGVYELERTIQSLNNINEELNELSKRGEAVSLFPIDKLESFKIDLKEIYQINLAIISKRIKEERENLKQLIFELEKYKEKSSKLTELLNKKSKLETEIRRLQEKVEEIEKLENILEERKLQKKEQFKKFFSKIMELKNFYVSLIEKFMKEVEGDEVLKNISFKLFINDNRESYREEILSNVHRRKISPYYDKIEKTIEEIFGKINEFLSNEAKNSEELIETLSLLEDLLLREDFYKSATSEEKILNDIDIFELEFHIDLYLKGKPLKKLSIGERAVAMLKLYLAYDDVPLLIDQPEEGLDNSYISTELVETLRRAKKKRQIIIATHNANLVVNTDAEQIIVAEYRDGRISYTSGALENPEIREKIITILEGGKQAFENREKKLGIRA